MLSTLLLPTLLTLATAQQPTTITIPNIGGDSNSIAASVITATSDATTLALHCVESPCGLFPQQTLVYGPHTWNVDMSDPDTDFTATMDCDVGPSTAVCRETAGGSEANFPGSSTTTYEGTEVGSATVTVTAGAEKLGLTGSAGSVAASQTGSAGSMASQTEVASASSGASTAGITSAPGASSAAGVSGSRTASAALSASSAGAGGRAGGIRGGLVGAAAGVFGGLLL